VALISFAGSHPEVAKSAWVAPNATLIGAVTISPNATVMFGAVLRADRDAIRLGADSNLQDNVVVHGDPGFPALIGSGVSVGHGAIVHGATVSDHVLIGMGAVLLNGCEIGSECIIAAGTVVLEGAIIPPGSLVAGVPGKIRRETTPEERAHIRGNAGTYQELGKRYRAEVL
jgi:carbonic anhydrase/acetyltransferase-like protein (isoleucine patch superfamily)